MESGLNKVSISLHCKVRTWESIQTLTCVGIHTMKICYVQIINSWDRAMDYPLPAKSIDIGDLIYQTNVGIIQDSPVN
jgi:hypothetical protein